MNIDAARRDMVDMMRREISDGFRADMTRRAWLIAGGILGCITALLGTLDAPQGVLAPIGGLWAGIACGHTIVLIRTYGMRRRVMAVIDDENNAGDESA